MELSINRSFSQITVSGNRTCSIQPTNSRISPPTCVAPAVKDTSTVDVLAGIQPHSNLSGHATFGAAAFYTVAAFYGTARIPFSFTSDEFNGINKGSDGIIRPIVSRTYRTLEEAVWENAFSRVYLGVHWSFDATAGIESGKRIAIKVSTSALRRLRGKTSR